MHNTVLLTGGNSDFLSSIYAKDIKRWYPASTPNSVLPAFIKGFNLFIYLFIYLKRRGKGGRKRERSTDETELPLTHAPIREQARIPGMCPNWKSNQ